MARDPLDVIEQRESGGRNVPNYKYGPGFTASGHYQMINATWRRWAKDAGVDISQYPRAMDAPKEVQRVVAQHGFDTEGWKPWAASEPGRRQEAKPVATLRKDGAPGPADVPTLPTNVDQGLLASVYQPLTQLKNDVEVKQQQQAHQQAVDKGQEQAVQLQEQAAQPMSPTAPLATPAPLAAETPDFAALMLPRIRRGLLADPTDYGLLGGRYS